VDELGLTDGTSDGDADGDKLEASLGLTDGTSDGDADGDKLEASRQLPLHAPVTEASQHASSVANKVCQLCENHPQSEF
jgi:hypothetical protein